MNRTNYTFYEFEAIVCGERGLPKKAFSELKDLIVPLSAVERAEPEEELSACLSLSVRGGEEVIQCKNYVGTIALPCGVSVEILPKIAGEDTRADSRRLVIEMLKACGNIPYRSFHDAEVRTESLNLFEIYIRLFLNELFVLAKKGFRAGYVEEESNGTRFGGKLLFKEQVQHNSVHRERFYVRRDDFNFNRAENRLIKTTLQFVQRISADEENRRDIRRCLLFFEEIDSSENTERDLAGCTADRSAKDYAPVLKLCRVFLRKKGFTMYGGRHNVVALLFPMERLYERFIAHEMRGYSRIRGWEQYDQNNGKALFDGRQFVLRPDILLKNGERTVIVDTKWKRLLDDRSVNYGISQADMYQMYAYHTRYPNVEQVILLYPLYGPLAVDDYRIREMGIRVGVRFFDLFGHLRGKPFEECVVPREFL